MVTAVLTIIVILILSFCLFYTRKKQHNYPPYIRGWLPWFGVAFQFGRAPLDFVEKARAKYGPVFTVLAAGKRLTFITLHEDFNTFFTSKDVDFQQAVQDPVRHTASIEKDSFNKNHHICHAFIKERLTRSNLSVFFADLCDDFNNQLKLMKQEGSDDLADIVRCLMYPAVMSNLLGKECCPNCQTEKEEFKKHFLVYDEGFEYGTQLPEFFLREWANSKTWLLTFMENIIFQAQKNKPSKADAKTLLHHLMLNITDKFVSNYGLLMVWASLANAIPITFWTLGFILSEPSVYKTAMQEITSVFACKDTTNITVTESDLGSLTYIKCCMLESIRLRSPGAITRKVVQPLRIQNYIIPPGDLLMLSPFWAHRNPKLFPDPEKFIPERWKHSDLEKNVFLEGFVAFGGGRYQCPGRWYALMEIQMFVSLTLYKYEFTLLDALPKPSLRHLVGTQQPEGPCRVHYKQIK
ncbi:24-hydroxycholesterol 7-alpha-hydroxylase isoform X1 [Polypterus senegalus]|uniref:24-hydroxycholesterol 7-alpha-hydroxylase isoform X1 n=1 Tax=Polypterus senegalus TaxID=55291 RepID=UPI001962BC7D|nr:24-hydroxycholesterol 7-alpha-hydroxylase isoform X1 [Polypterus senegalus]